MQLRETRQSRSVSGERPVLPFLYLDTVWIQLTGTVCNIACKHCFIGCGPKVRRHEVMSEHGVHTVLEQADELGVRGVWFTGGEPLLHPAFVRLCADALERFPVGVLTNAMLIDRALADELSRLFYAAPYNFEIRVSLDGATEETNDAVRGSGVFAATCRGIQHLAEAGLLPIVAVATVEPGKSEDRATFVRLLQNLGVSRPRIRWIPPFRIGREATRKGGRRYADHERILSSELALAADASLRLQCGTSRTVTADGVYACPILIDEPAYRVADTLIGSLVDNRVGHGACHTCWVQGFSCSA